MIERTVMDEAMAEEAEVVVGGKVVKMKTTVGGLLVEGREVVRVGDCCVQW